jgi:hypothetical protein
MYTAISPSNGEDKERKYQRKKSIELTVWDGKDPKKYADSFKIRA